MAGDGLGPLIHTHPWRMTGAIVGIAVMFLGVPAALLVWAIADPPDWSELEPMGWLGVILVFVVFPGLAITMLRKARRSASNQVALHAGGLVYLKEGVVHEVLWRDVISLTSEVRQEQALGAPVVHTHTLKTAAGELVITHAIADIDALMLAVRRGTLEVMLPAALEALEAGKVVDFGPVRIDRTRIVCDGKPLPWTDVAAVDRDAGSLQVWSADRKRPFARLLLSSLRNDHLLTALADRLRGCESF